jgi:hypothetical protein
MAGIFAIRQPEALLSARTDHAYAANGILVVQVCHLGPISREIPQPAPREALMRRIAGQ